ncbi:hypothetical protein PhiCh1p86 [Natrialba phage PhiCh1]|uniref:Virus protein phiCh1-VP85 n=2 Tax=root TaxID=1 RepID=D3T2D7_NATMM|nr:hypothetical protein [Natrialba magadii]NP_666003.1 hypothetical protein PhiCh1p86 [Natrialba phage PhiCh1]YP_010078112.1 uncharacterized protein KMC42_gp82 [Natrialba phage PhiCh1]AAM88759.1 unknown [Natrialba phage PhiCh1]ADD07746.1 virus protein phiCh1-VP85 [Natrialba magadii ATCC 43099]ELY22993.1 hypothetical protein C500_21055 [Natrialba magadii ATCC 43099]QBJ01263.1 uncharacterized protein PhiCh1_405 [Natrialba phage PhiCh1]
MTDFTLDTDGTDLVSNPLEDMMRRHHEDVERAYHLGLLHGINAQSMAEAKRDVMSFEDYPWSPEPERDRDA